MHTTVCYRAYGANGTTSTHGATPRKVASLFFERNPRARKCNVTEGREDESRFVVAYGRKSENQWPDSWPDVTRAAVGTLPDVTRVNGGASLKAE